MGLSATGDTGVACFVRSAVSQSPRPTILATRPSLTGVILRRGATKDSLLPGEGSSISTTLVSV